jgi:membrane peptidoglycan carboxypeptidase
MSRWIDSVELNARIARRMPDLESWNLSRVVPRSRHVAIISALSILAVLTVTEMRFSTLQSALLSRWAGQMTFQVANGANEDILFPAHGPYNERLGYTKLPDFVGNLSRKGYVTEQQARASRAMQWFQRVGGFPPYATKTSTGLTLLGADGEPFFTYRQPGNVYPDFDAVPEAVVHSLLFVENRELLDLANPRRNPAIEWDRLALALAKFGSASGSGTTPGGSTIATQIEKLRHSPAGRTTGPVEKLRQMVSASLNAYRDGSNTIPFRRQVIVDALNLMPLSGFPRHGEVIGLGDGLTLWYGADFAGVNRALTAPVRTDADLARKGLALKQTLSLIIAQRRPAYFLGKGRDELETLTNSYLRLMAANGDISDRLAVAAAGARLRFNDRQPLAEQLAVDTGKAGNAIRVELARLLGGTTFYDLHRLDLTAETTVNTNAQAQATQLLRSLKEPERLSELGLAGSRLISSGPPADVNYSLTLYERGPAFNYLRIQTDSLDKPLDVNVGTKLELGSTAKVRTLISYLDIIADEYAAQRAKPRSMLEKTKVEGDPLTAWVAGELLANGDRGLRAMLDAAMERKYSAGTGERFFTAGGMHRFANFSSRHGGMMTVTHALQQSVNLVFIRMMRDVVDYHIARIPGTQGLLDDPGHPARTAYLQTFADVEGRQYLARFLPDYRKLDRQAILARIAERAKFLRPRLAAAYRTVLPDASYEEFAAFINRWAAAKLTDEEEMQRLYETYALDRLNLADRSYVASIHPLELWLAGYLHAHPGASWHDIAAASVAVRQESYQWLMKPNKFVGQNRRIRTMLERQAFVPIHKKWQRLGYPFDRLTPSYATAIGVSGDRPDALAELMGIIVSDGYRYPAIRIKQVRFAEATPYETVMKPAPRPGERVLRPEIAAVMRRALVDIVEHGTARRAFEAVRGLDGKPLIIGGKTGTGDNRQQRFAARGRLVGSTARSRTATFVFFLGDRYFGTITAFVEGTEADRYSFTSALPTQLFKVLSPVIETMMRPDGIDPQS